jgi:hypothetical protein
VLRFYFLLFSLLPFCSIAQEVDVDVKEIDHFKEKQAGDSFLITPRIVEADKINKLKKDKAFWYADSSFQEKGANSNYRPVKNDKVLQFILWLLILGGFGAAIAWYLASSNVGLFQKRAAAQSTAEEEAMLKNIFEIDYSKEIEKATAKQDYRLAVRLHYLQLLRNLSDRQIIRYQQDRTNFDYLLQLNGTEHYNPFFRLTRHYEFTWYGHFEIDQRVYSLIRDEFNQFDNKLQLIPA